MYEYIIKYNEAIVWEGTDGCDKQYIFELTVYFMEIISLTLKIIKDREIGATGNGKDVVNVINTRYKRYLR